MYIEPVQFENNIPIAYDAARLGWKHLHCHEGVIEVLLIVSGQAKVTVGFEAFNMKAGDYTVIKNRDAHSICGEQGDCCVISLYFDMEFYKEPIPYLEYVFFACESFDLARYKNESVFIRNMILFIITYLLNDEYADLEKAKEAALNLILKLVDDYDMRNYYNRNWVVSYNKTEKYYKIGKYMFENYSRKNILEYISTKEYYSKSYITHLFKDVSASSFHDVLSYIRIYNSIQLLLTTDKQINDISDEMGFSDIKYYTSTFKKWYLCTPSEYRKNNQSEVLKSNKCTNISREEIVTLTAKLKNEMHDETEYRTAINPLTLKIMDSTNSLLKNEYGESLAIVDTDVSKDLKDANPNDEVQRHRVFIGVEDRQGTEVYEELANRVASFEKAGFQPIMTISFKDSISQCKRIMEQCVEVMGIENTSQLDWMITYKNPGDRITVDKLSEVGKHVLGLSKNMKVVFLI